MTRSTFETADESSDTPRVEPRRQLGQQVVVIATIQMSGDRHEFDAWAYDVSSCGIRFRCRAQLPDAVEVIADSGRAAWVQILRRVEIAESVWEYGARVCRPGTHQVSES